MKTTAIFCAGKNRFGQPCTNRVKTAGAFCGRCRGGVPTTPEGPSQGITQSSSPAPSPVPPPLLSLPAPDEEWTPATRLRQRLAPLAANNPDLAELVEVSARLAASTRAANTKAAYKQHLRTFERFCDKVGIDSTPPIAPETVCLFLAFLTVYRRSDPTSGERVQEGAPLAHSYLRSAIAALGHWHTAKGLADPTEDPAVSAVLEGYGKTYGTATKGSDPITLDLLGAMCTPLCQPSPNAERDLFLVLIGTDPDLPLGPSQIAGIRHSRVLLPETPLDPAVVLTSSQGTKALNPVALHRNGIKAVCPVTALIDLVSATPEPKPLLNGTSGALNREGVVWILNRLVKRAKATPIEVKDRLPKISVEDRLRIAVLLQKPDDADLRDRAIVTALFWGCFRGEEVAPTRFHELKFVEHGIEWTRPKKKNHQQHDSPPRALPKTDDPFVCPVTAMTEWLERLEELHGRPLNADDPIFPPLRQRGTLDKPISRNAVNDVIANLARRVGLTGHYTSHSPRAGFVTTAIDANIPREHIQRHGDWASSKGLDPYYRKTRTWSPTSNAAMQLSRLRQDGV